MSLIPVSNHQQGWPEANWTKWVPCLRGPALELSTLGCSKNTQHTTCYTENNMAPHLLRPVLFTSTQCSTYVYEYTHESIIRLLLIISPVTTGKILLITKQKSIWNWCYILLYYFCKLNNSKEKRSFMLQRLINHTYMLEVITNYGAAEDEL